jgi:hypothetical protein
VAHFIRQGYSTRNRVRETRGERYVFGDDGPAAFPAPVAHEDDAERAVRAGLRILEAIEELNQGDEKLQRHTQGGSPCAWTLSFESGDDSGRARRAMLLELSSGCGKFSRRVSSR